MTQMIPGISRKAHFHLEDFGGLRTLWNVVTCARNSSFPWEKAIDGQLYFQVLMDLVLPEDIHHCH